MAKETIETAYCWVEYDRYRLSILFDLTETGIIMKRVSLLLVIVLLLTACSPSESSEQTPSYIFSDKTYNQISQQIDIILLN